MQLRTLSVNYDIQKFALGGSTPVNRRAKANQTRGLCRVAGALPKSWAHHYEPDTKRQSMQWHHLGSPSPKKFKCSPSAGKVMMTVFCYHRGVIFIDFLPKGETLNSHKYCDTLKKLVRAIRVKRPSMQKVILHHDNARPQTARATAAAIAKKGWMVMPHPAY